MLERYVATENTPREETVEREASLETEPICYAQTEADTPVLSPIANTRLSPQRQRKLKGKGAQKAYRNRPKRKKVGPSSNHGPTKKPDHGLTQQVQAKKGEDGLYEVHIEFSEAEHLADLIGVHQRDVMQAVVEDNNERKLTETQSDTEEQNQDTPEGGAEGDQRVNLDPDSDEELESDLD